MMITKKIFRIIPCLLCIAISFAKDKFFCDFEDLNSCQWTQDKSDDFDWTRNKAFTDTHGTGPLTDHTKGLDPVNKKQGPGSIRHNGGKCIHVLEGAWKRPKEGEFLMTFEGCGLDRLEFQLLPNGTLMLTEWGMCVKPTSSVTDGARVGVFSSCDATDTWSWTAQGSLQYKKKMCLKPETGGAHPRNHVDFVLDSVCDERQNYLEFMRTSGWYLYIRKRSRRNDKARLISPLTTKAKSCLLFFYYMYGYYVNELRVYVKSGGKMGLPVWRRSGEQGDKWYQAQVAVNNQTSSYQYVIEGASSSGIISYEHIAIDDISLMDSCPRVSTTLASSTSRTSSEDESKKVKRIFTVFTTPASSPSQTSSEDKGTTDDSRRIIIITTTVGAGVFLSIVLIVLLMKYKRRKRAPKLSTPVNIPLEANEISPEPLPVDEEPCYETVGKFYDDVGTEDTSAEGRASLHDRVGVPSNADKTSGYETPVENQHQTSGYETPVENQHPGSGNETVARLDREFYIDVDTNAKKSEEISAEGRTSDHEEVEVPSNAHKSSVHTELNKRPDTLKSGATGDGDSRAFLKKVDIIDIYVIQVPEEPQYETPGQNETCEEPKLSLENPVHTELDVNDKNTTEDGSYRKLVKQDSDHVIPAHEGRESYEDI